MLLFRSEEHVDKWCAQWNLPKGALLTLGQTWRLAVAWYGDDRRLLDWRRRTVDETEAVFAQLGFTSSFWDLRG